MKPTFIFLIYFLFLPAISWAQLDPSSSLLLNGGRNDTLDESGLDSGRYEVRPSGRSAPVTPLRSPETPAPTPAPVAPRSQATPPSSQSTPPPVTVKEGDTSAEAPPRPPAPARPSKSDSRQAAPRSENLFDIEVSSFYFYHSARADYWYRRFETHGPGVRLGVKVSLSPIWDFRSSIASSLSSSLSNNPSEKDSSTEVNYQWIDAGFDVKLGTNRSGPAMHLNLSYAELDIRVPAGEDHRARLLTSGARLGLDGTFPSSTGVSAWLWGFHLMPFATVEEKSTDLKLKSGSRPRSSVYEIYLGREVTWGANNTMFWKLSHRIQQTRYKGSARLADPLTGTRPKGLSVTESMIFLETGLTFGP